MFSLLPSIASNTHYIKITLDISKVKACIKSVFSQKCFIVDADNNLLINAEKPFKSLKMNTSDQYRSPYTTDINIKYVKYTVVFT